MVVSLMDSLDGSESTIWGNVDLKHCSTLRRPLLYNSHSLCPFEKVYSIIHHWTPMSSFFGLLRTKLYWFTQWSKIKRFFFSGWRLCTYLSMYVCIGLGVKWFCLLMAVKTTKWFTGHIETNLSKINLTKSENSKTCLFCEF